MSEKDILSSVSYPHLNRLDFLYPGPQVVLGHEINWTLKEDGSNCGIALINGEIEIRSRNMERANMEFYTALKTCPEYHGIVDLLESAPQWNDEYVLFGELCQKGKSPTRLKTHPETKFLPFDIWSKREQKFFSYTRLYQECYHSKIPCVELLGTCKAASLEELYGFRDMILKICLDRGEEGTVGKILAETPYNTGENVGIGNGTIYFKEKIDTPKVSKIPREINPNRVQLPVLPDSEIYGAIDKVRMEFGDNYFKDIRQAMPKIAEYVSVECKHHLNSAPRNLFQYYQNKVSDIVGEEA